MGKLGKRIDEMVVINKNDYREEIFNEILIAAVKVVKDNLESKGGNNEVLNEQNRERNLR